MLQGARSYREYNLGVYGIVLPIINAWTSQLSVIDIVNELFDLATQLVETPASDPETNNTKRLPKSQLPELASCLFKCFQERLDWLERYALASTRYHGLANAYAQCNGT